MTTKAFKAILI